MPTTEEIIVGLRYRGTTSNTISDLTEPTSGTFYYNYPRVYGKRSGVYWFLGEGEVPTKKRKLTDIIGEPDWVL